MLGLTNSEGSDGNTSWSEFGRMALVLIPSESRVFCTMFANQSY